MRRGRIGLAVVADVVVAGDSRSRFAEVVGSCSQWFVAMGSQCIDPAFAIVGSPWRGG